jgi:hypothetical protein
MMYYKHAVPLELGIWNIDPTLSSGRSAVFIETFTPRKVSPAPVGATYPVLAHAAPLGLETVFVT